MATNVDNRQINKQFTKFVIPSVIGMTVQALYIVLDGVVVGQGIGEIALAAINIVFPFSMIVIALAMLIAVGGANVYSFYKGQKEFAKANNIFCQCLTMAAITGIVLAIPSFFLRSQLTLLAGADELLHPSAVAYLKWLSTFFLFQMVVCVVATFVRNDDAPKLVMLATITGAVINAVLDVVFILVLHKGIEVAAITNGVGMLIELSFYAVYFGRKKGMLRINKPMFSFADVKRVLSNGFATFLMEFSLPVITFTFNLAIMHTVGTLGVSAYSIVGYVCAIVNLMLIGVSQGAQPLMSLYHGSGDKRAFRHTYHLGLWTNLIVPVILVGLSAVFSEGIVTLFHSQNPELTALTVHMLRLYPLGHVAIGATMMNILYFQTTERNSLSNIVSFLRSMGFIQVFVLLSVFVFNGRGLYLAFFAGELCHLIISQALVFKTKRQEDQASQKHGFSGKKAITS